MIDESPLDIVIFHEIMRLTLFHYLYTHAYESRSSTMILPCLGSQGGGL